MNNNRKKKHMQKSYNIKENKINLMLIFKDEEGDEVFPIWPHSGLATTCRFEEHKKIGATPQSIDLKIFIQKCIPDMVQNNVQFGIFYNQNRNGLVVDGELLKQAIEGEINTVWK